LSREKSEPKQVKGAVSPWLGYLWKGLSRVAELEADGNFVGALNALCSLVNDLPEDLRNQFLKKAQQCQKEMAIIRSTTKSTSLFATFVVKNRRLQNYAKDFLASFKREFFSALDDRGVYMEVKAPKIARGRVL